MDVRQRFARNVRKLRNAAGISQDELADRANLHRTYISGIERAVRNPSITVVDDLAKALGVAAGSLID